MIAGRVKQRQEGRKMSRRILRIVSIFLCGMAMSSGCWESDAAAKDLPFRQGERMVYQARWGIVSAGQSVIEILSDETVNDVRAFHFAMTTTTNAALDLFYKVRERKDSWMDLNRMRSVLYKEKEEGNHPRDVVVTFDWAKRTVTRYEHGKAGDMISIPPGTIDPLGLFFFIRMSKIKLGDVLEFPVTDGKKYWDVRATVVRQERLTIGGKTYDTLLVMPDMKRIEDVFKKKDEQPDLMIWFSADDRQVPVKIESKVIIGTFVFELVSATF
jgi:hypothetical protein